jgi:uncharacterized protein (DUF2147 family)
MQMKKLILISVVALAAAGCGGRGAAQAKATPSPTIAWDIAGKLACVQAARNDSVTRITAKASSITELQNTALREEQLNTIGLIKVWCAKNPPPTGSLCDWGIGTFDTNGEKITAANCKEHDLS